MHKMELNSPAGDFESLRAAVFNGADAVYLGVKMFSARRLAHNFSMDDLRKAVKFAHFHGVKIYLTMNTLVRNDELELWFRTMEEAYLAGIDAVIIQEIWLAPLIKKYFPGLKVNASTQASLMNYHGINAAKGIDLAVLARELTEEEIKQIRENTKTKLEVFVHGHLCISYSGQCLISSLIGKRSGNRGVCASSCRKRYNTAGYLISAKDLMLADKIDRIYKVGIDSVKIEGRMKSPDYVAISTGTYRKQIDEAESGDFHALDGKQLSHLKMGFNREFTDGFYSGNKTIVGKDMPMNRGIYLGTVSSGKLLLESSVREGDGIGFFNPKKSRKLEGFVLRKMYKGTMQVSRAARGEIITIPSRHFSDGTKVYMTSGGVGSDISHIKLKEQQIAIQERDGFLFFLAGGGIEIRSDIALQEAKQHFLDRKTIEAELSKSKECGIGFQIKEFSMPQNKFLPNSRLTRMRKELEEALLASSNIQRASNFCRVPEHEEKIFGFAPRIVAKVYNLEGIREAEESGAYAIHYDIFSKDFMEAKSLCIKSKLFADTPVIATDKDIGHMQKILSAAKPDGLVIGNWGLLDIGFKGEMHGKYSLNIFNDVSLSAMRERGIIPTLSVELNAKQAMRMKNKEFMFYSYGQIPVMHFKGEFREKSLRDEKGYNFPLRVVNGNTEMLYSRPIAIYEHALELAGSGIKYFYLDLQKDAGKMVGIYNAILAGERLDISHLKQGTTIGNYNKGVA